MFFGQPERLRALSMLNNQDIKSLITYSATLKPLNDGDLRLCRNLCLGSLIEAERETSMKHIVLPFTPQQALALVQDIQTFRPLLIRAYEGDFMTIEQENPTPPEKSIPLPFDDPLGF